TRPLCPTAAEFGMPQWNLGMSSYAFSGAGRIVCAYTTAGLGEPARLGLAPGPLQALETEFTEFGSVRADGDRVAFRAGAPHRPTSIITLNLQTGQHRVLKQATDLLDRTEPRIVNYLAKVEPVEFPTSG